MLIVQIKKKVHYVSVDFSQNEDFFEKLKENGFDMNLPTCFVMEGVTYYLNWDDVRNTFQKIAKQAQKDSILAFDFASDEFTRGLHLAAQVGEPPKFGLANDETPANKFLPLGFRSVEIWFGNHEIYHRYGMQVQNMSQVGRRENSSTKMHFCCLKV